MTEQDKIGLNEVHKYRAEVFNEITGYKIIELNSVTYSDALDELEHLIDYDPMILGGKLV